MAVDQFLPSGLKTSAVGSRQLDLYVYLAAEVPRLEVIATDDPVSLLHVSKGKRLVARGRIRNDRRRRFFRAGFISDRGRPLSVEYFTHAPLQESQQWSAISNSL